VSPLAGPYLLPRDGLMQIVLSCFDLTLKGSFLRHSHRFLVNARPDITGRVHRRALEDTQIERPRAERTEGQVPPSILTVVVISSTIGPCAQSGRWPIDRSVVLSTILMEKPT
jgi:hypothetical protein